MKNIYAHTGPTPKEGYVGYISVNQRESGIEVSVRSEGNPAPLGVITLSPEQCEHLATDLLAHINQEPPAKPDQQAQAGCDYCNNPMFAGFKCDNCGRKPEQQAQAGEPEVVAYLEHHKAGDNLQWDWTGKNCEGLITLQSHREAMVEKERECQLLGSALDKTRRQLKDEILGYVKTIGELHESIAKKDAALKVCVDELTSCAEVLEIFVNDGTAAPDSVIGGTAKNARAAIAQAESCLK
jgi:hypothetical protein